MAQIADVRLVLEEGALVGRVRVEVDVDLVFTPEEVADRARFRLFVALRGSDRGEEHEDSLSWLLPNLHVFAPEGLGAVSLLLGLDNYHRVRALSEEATISFRTELPLRSLDEDPRKDVCEVPPSFRTPDGIIEIPRKDEVYAHAQLFAEVQHFESEAVDVPGSDGTLERRLCEFLRDSF